MATNYFAPLQNAMAGTTQNLLLADQIRQQRAQQQARQNAFTNPDLVSGMRTLGAAGDIQGLGALSNVGTAQRQQQQLSREAAMERMQIFGPLSMRLREMPQEQLAQAYPGIAQRVKQMFPDSQIPDVFNEEAMQNINSAAEVWQAMQAGKKGATAGTSSYQPIVIENSITGERRLVSPLVDRGAGTTQLAPFDMPEGFQLTTETPEEKRRGKVEEKRDILREEISATREKEMEKVVGKETAERLSGQVDTAYEAVDAIPIILSSIDLLDTVETGGIDAALVKGKQILGIESADEAELAQNLGKAVLKQLKPTFGAQFTVAEGKELKGIEAGWGKSSAGNKRLLQNALRIYKNGINRGMRAARRTGDTETYNELSQSLQQINQAQPQTQTGGIRFIGWE